MYFVVLPLNAPADVRDVQNKFYFASRKDNIASYFTQEKSAVAEATKLAKENPGKQFAVMSMLRVFETTTPKVITKAINEHGELVLEKDKA